MQNEDYTTELVYNSINIPEKLRRTEAWTIYIFYFVALKIFNYFSVFKNSSLLEFFFYFVFYALCCELFKISEIKN